jgi:DNA-binding response OmpR family regulator
MRISLVDNEFDNTLVFEMTLKDNGFVVDTFNDPLLALENFKTDLYDRVLFFKSIFQR